MKSLKWVVVLFSVIFLFGCGGKDGG